MGWNLKYIQFKGGILIVYPFIWGFPGGSDSSTCVCVCVCVHARTYAYAWVCTYEREREREGEREKLLVKTCFPD